jgi:hypothetical protein
MFLDETGCILNEKMMPDVTMMVPELEIDKKISKTNISMDKLEIDKKSCRTTIVRSWYKKLPDLAPTKPPIPYLRPKKLSGESPYLGISLETSHLYY